jgi:hypothetical protein
MDDRIEAGGSKQRPDDPALPDLYAVKVTGSREALAKLLQTFELDVGCRHPQLEPAAGRNAVLLVFASRERIGEIQAAGYSVEVGENVSAQARERQAEIGRGDRFEGGRVTPRGLGRKPGESGPGGPGGERKGGPAR